MIFYALLVIIVILASIITARLISANTVRLSIRPQLSILINGTPFTVPSGVGINQSLWRDHSLDNFGVYGRSPLTTRDSSGIIFLESNTIRNFTMEEFLAVWGQTADDSQVVGNPVPPNYSACTTVNGQTLTGIQNVVLTDNERIELEIVQGGCIAQS